jgi:hypothetical protein
MVSDKAFDLSPPTFFPDLISDNRNLVIQERFGIDLHADADNW